MSDDHTHNWLIKPAYRELAKVYLLFLILAIAYIGYVLYKFGKIDHSILFFFGMVLGFSINLLPSRLTLNRNSLKYTYFIPFNIQTVEIPVKDIQNVEILEKVHPRTLYPYQGKALSITCANAVEILPLSVLSNSEDIVHSIQTLMGNANPNYTKTQRHRFRLLKIILLDAALKLCSQALLFTSVKTFFPTLE